MLSLNPKRTKASLEEFRNKASLPGLLPERVTLELSYACNLSCPSCPRHHVTVPPKRLKMDAGLAKRLLDEASEWGVKALVPFFRGESVLHPNLDDIIAHAKKRGVESVQLASNATLMKPDIAEKVLGAGLDFISFSVDTIDPSEYAQKRRNGDLGNTLDNIEKFLALRETVNPATTVQISSVDSGSRDGKAESLKRAFIDYWHERSCDVRFYPRHSEDGNFGSLAPQYVAPYEVRLPCLKLVTDVVILADGEVAICNHDWDRMAHGSLGNVTRSSIAEVYGSQPYKEIRERHDRGELDGMLPCERCHHWQAYYLDEKRIGEFYHAGQAKRG